MRPAEKRPLLVLVATGAGAMLEGNMAVPVPMER